MPDTSSNRYGSASGNTGKMSKITETLLTTIFSATSVFTTAEVAEAADVHLASASTRLKQLADEEGLIRVRRGLWALPNHPDFSPYAVVPHLFDGDESGYVSLLSALHLHGMIEQIPQAVHIMTTRQRPDLSTPVGTYEFHKIQPELYGGYVPYDRMWSFQIARPEKALFDVCYLAQRKGKRFSHLPELTLSSDFDREELSEWVDRINYDRLRTAVRQQAEEVLKSSGKTQSL